MKDLPPFYVGQKVIAVKDTSTLKKNNEYQISSINQHPCGCWVVCVGIIGDINNGQLRCAKHNAIAPSQDPYVYHYASHFAPIEQTFQSITFKEVIEIESPLIGIN